VRNEPEGYVKPLCAFNQITSKSNIIMASVNKVILIGNLTRDPEMRTTPKGTPICQFSLAVNRKWKNEGGQEQEEVTYVDIEAWGKQGETIGKYCTKGRPLYIEGRLRQDRWEDKNTKEKRSRMKVVMAEFQFLGTAPAGGNAGGGANSQGANSSPARSAAPAPASGGSDEENVPF
jgi:single-strand DNA-binding protein